MGLIYCQDCGSQISDQATSCPKCGRPSELLSKPLDEDEENIETGPTNVAPTTPTPQTTDNQKTNKSKQIASVGPFSLRNRSSHPIVNKHRNVPIQQVVRSQNIQTRNLYMQQHGPSPYGQHQHTSGMATTGFVLGICSVIIFAIILGPLAIVFSHMAKGEIKRNPNLSGDGLATAGLVLGIIATVIGAIILLYYPRHWYWYYD